MDIVRCLYRVIGHYSHTKITGRMVMNEPTEAQIKESCLLFATSATISLGGKVMRNLVTANEELNKWCGTEGINYYEGDTALGFLFKYAVPKVKKLCGSEIHIEFVFRDNFVDCCIFYYPEGSGYKSWVSPGKTDALALFWAIWEVMKGGS